MRNEGGVKGRNDRMAEGKERKRRKKKLISSKFNFIKKKFHNMQHLSSVLCESKKFQCGAENYASRREQKKTCK